MSITVSKFGGGFKLGFSSIFWGFLFFFDFRIQGFDILPDLIGYWLIYSGLKELVSRSSHFTESKKYSLVLGILSVFDLYQVQMPVEQFSIGPLTGFVMLLGIVITILDLLMVYHLCYGIADLAERRGVIELKSIALNRWKYYLYLKVATTVVGPIVLIIPMLVMLLFIPLIFVSIIVIILMMGLMRQAEYL